MDINNEVLLQEFLCKKLNSLQEDEPFFHQFSNGYQVQLISNELHFVRVSDPSGIERVAYCAMTEPSWDNRKVFFARSKNLYLTPAIQDGTEELNLFGGLNNEEPFIPIIYDEDYEAEYFQMSTLHPEPVCVSSVLTGRYIALGLPVSYYRYRMEQHEIDWNFLPELLSL